MNLAPKSESGLALGAWGAVQASGAGVAVALGGILRDVAAAVGGPAFGYMSVYSLELLLLLLTLAIMGPLIRGKSSFQNLGNNMRS
jgi:BCD family chlorophyll transporter-like MFS transporter